MKIIYTILLFVCANADATVYYVSNKGNDDNNGTSTTTAWRTVAKVNVASFLPGDKILFKKGGVWNERLNPHSSGSLGKVITFGSYGKGVKPIFTGLQKQLGFTNDGNIWTATATSSVPDLNTVLVNGSIKAKARYPNTGYLTFTSYTGNSQITGSLSGTPNYTGAEIVVRSTHWILDISKITSQVSGTLTFLPALTYIPNLGANGYFIQNSPLVLDTAGEWSYDRTSKALKVYSSTSPSVQIATIDTLVYINNVGYLTFDGLSMYGANGTAFQLRTANNITIQNCSIDNSGRWGIAGILSNHITIFKNTIQNSLCNAVYFVTPDFAKPGCDHITVDNNYIKNSGTMAGMALGQYTRNFGIFVSGNETTIINNRIDSTGYVPLMFIGRNSLIKNNYISNFGFVKDDGGGIYTVIGRNYPPDTNDGSIIRSNIVINGIGAPEGALPSATIPAAGIYLDDYTRNVIVDSNTVSNCKTSAICLNGTNSITLKENTVVNGIGAGLAIYGANDIISNLNIKRNVFFSQNPKQFNLSRNSGTSMGDIDSNYYLGPSVENNNINLSGTLYKFSDWSGKTGHDKHSVFVSSNMENSTTLFYFNPNKTNKTISLKGTYKDAKGKLYKKSIMLPSFRSVILFKVP